MGGTPGDVAAMELRMSAVNDECIGYSDWDRKLEIHTLAKANAYQTHRPLDKGDWWGYTAPSAANSSCAPMCNLPVVIIRIKARIPAGGGQNNPRNVPENAFVMKEEMGTWNKKHMMSDKAVEGSYKHLEVAAPTSAYQVTDYARYIPLPASNTDGYIDQYVANNVTQYVGLTKEHVTVATSVFICGLQLFNPQHITEHYIHVHGLPQGVASLKPLETITVDKDTAYTCPDLKLIEEVGTEEKAMMVEAVYNMSVTKGVFQANTNNRKAASLRRTRAQEFIKELRKACTEQFFGRFFMLLGRTLRAAGQNIQGDFSVKWSVIEECLYKAISDLEGVTRLDNFLNLNYTRFSGRTLELLIYDVDREVDAFQGTWDKTTHPGKYMHSLLTKYELIYDIVRNLGDKYAQLKECAKKEIAKLYFDSDGIKDISELQQFLLDKFEAKSIADSYNKDVIHVGKKIPAQVAKVKEGKWSKEDLEKFRLTWQKKAPKREVERANTAKVIAFIKKLDEEKKDLRNTAVASNKDYTNFLKTNNIKCCSSCFAQSCLAKYHTAKALGFGFKNNKNCRREEEGWKGWSFGHLDNLKPPEDRPVIDTVTVSIRPETVLVGHDGLYDELLPEAKPPGSATGIPSLMARMSTKPRPRFNAKTVPKCGELTTLTDSTKECVICNLGGFYSFELMDHLDTDHGLDVTAGATVADWNSALKRHEEAEAQKACEWSDDEYGYDYESEPESIPESYSLGSPPTTPAKNMSVSSAVHEAFQENMVPWKRDMEAQWDQYKQLDKEAKGTALIEVNNKLEGLNAASLTHAGALSQITNFNSHVETMLSKVSANQNKNDAKIERIESTLVNISQNLRVIQNRSEHGDPNRAEIDLIKHHLASMQFKSEHADPEQAENTRKISVIESNQARMMETLAVLQKENYIMWQEIIQTRKHTDPKFLESIMKLSPADRNQAQMLDLLSSIVNYNNGTRERLDRIEEEVTSKVEGVTNSIVDFNNDMRERLDKFEENVTPKVGGATNLGTPKYPDIVDKDMATPIYHDVGVYKKGDVNFSAKEETAGLCSSNKPPSSPKSSAETTTTGLAYPTTSGQDSATTMETSSTSVPNLPVKKEISQARSQSNEMPQADTPLTKPPPPISKRKHKSNFGGFSGLMGAMVISALVLAMAAPSLAAPASTPSSVLSSLQPSPYRTIYPLLEMETRTWAYRFAEVEDAAYSIIDDACAYVAMADKQCSDHPTACRTTMLNLENFKKAMSKSFDVIFLLQRLCDVGSVPPSEQAYKRCRSGEDWRPKEFTSGKYKFLDGMLEAFTPDFESAEQLHGRHRRGTDYTNSRQPRFAISVPILIGLAVGAGVIGTAGITAKVVAEEESSRVMKAVRAGRRVDIANNLKNNFIAHNFTEKLAVELDVIRTTEAISTHATVLLHDAEDLKQELSQLASRRDKLKYGSVFAEEYWNAIKDVNLDNGIGLTSAEVNRKTRLSAELSTLVTTLSPISNLSTSCSNQILTKVLLIPVINHRRRTEIEIAGDRMIPRSLPIRHEATNYFIIAKDSVLSRETDLFGRSSHVVGRICTASTSINASSIPSTEVISETFRLEFPGMIELNETCKNESTIHVISSPATVTVPILCSVESSVFSCEAVIIRSGDSKLVHTTHHRTIIVQDSLVEDMVAIDNDTFVQTQVDTDTSGILEPRSWLQSLANSYKIPLIVIGIIIMAVILAAVIPAGMMWKKTGAVGGVSIKNYNSNLVSADVSNKMDGDLGGAMIDPMIPDPIDPVAVDQEAEEEEELDIVEILNKPAHLRSAREMIAAENWAKQEETCRRLAARPFQLPSGTIAFGL